MPWFGRMSLHLPHILLSSKRVVSFTTECIPGEKAGLAGTWEEGNFNEKLEKETCWPEVFRGNLIAGDQRLR